jgi:ABC-type antimicrobial peptide transport system permease subunit
MTPKIFTTILLCLISILSIAAQAPLRSTQTGQTALLNTVSSMPPNTILIIFGIVLLICALSICYALRVLIKISKLQVISRTN